MADSNSLVGEFFTGTTFIPSGATNAVLITSQAFDISTKVKMFAAGGTVYLMGCTMGTTALSGTMLVAGITTGYLLGATEVFEINGPAKFYLASLGATATICIVKGKSG